MQQQRTEQHSAPLAQGLRTVTHLHNVHACTYLCARTHTHTHTYTHTHSIHVLCTLTILKAGVQGILIWVVAAVFVELLIESGRGVGVVEEAVLAALSGLGLVTAL